MQNPRVVFLSVDAIVMMKSGAARVFGHRIPSSPARNPIRLIRVAYLGKLCVLISDAKRVLIIESVLNVSMPFQLSQGGLGVWLVSERTSEERR